MRHLALEINPKPKKCQAASGNRLPVCWRFPAGAIKNGGLRVHKGQTVGRGEWGFRKEKLACLIQEASFEEEWCLDENVPKGVIIWSSNVLGTLHNKPTQNMELFKKSWDISSWLTNWLRGKKNQMWALNRHYSEWYIVTLSTFLGTGINWFSQY